MLVLKIGVLRLAQRSLRMTKEESFTDEASLRFRMTQGHGIRAEDHARFFDSTRLDSARRFTSLRMTEEAEKPQ
jgi:hypothetical protein